MAPALKINEKQDVNISILEHEEDAVDAPIKETPMAEADTQQRIKKLIDKSLKNAQKQLAASTDYQLYYGKVPGPR